MHMIWSYVAAGVLTAAAAAAVVHGEVGALEVRFVDAATQGVVQGLSLLSDEAAGTPASTLTPAIHPGPLPH